ncbi:peptide deformylase [Persephonella atlantica]|uniref:Peptide deformylase n=1 Tax=Persephonella atlantica TaxID=2699429 RepID=A0ABS1GF92_9AQUI|nr:peptide deformylase [Persephonella atlantica]MBK3331526.1 peptide deformylase [Persephonella atlantica]
MAYEIRTWPDRILKQKMKEVDFFDERLKEYVDVMFERMYQLEGVGLAANQIGIPYQIIVIDTNTKKYDQQEGEEGVKMVLINPQIVKKEGEIESTEGCLSFPGVQITIPRAEKVVVKAKDIEGKDIEIEGENFLAVVLQHEIDHINGIPFINYLPPVKRRIVLDRYMKKKKELAKAK